jgi:catechol 2,3-dioxygenase-like lactoylglutathione lyase family enzyme
VEQRVSLITLGVADLDAAREFYERVFGWKAAESPPEIVFFDCNGVVFSLFAHNDLARDMASDAGRTGYEGFALAHNVASKEAVDELFAKLREQGVTIDKPPQAADWGGYSGYFSDPDGHKWEVAYNPFWTILEDGRISMTAG